MHGALLSANRNGIGRRIRTARADQGDERQESNRCWQGPSQILLPWCSMRGRGEEFAGSGKLELRRAAVGAALPRQQILRPAYPTSDYVGRGAPGTRVLRMTLRGGWTAVDDRTLRGSWFPTSQNRDMGHPFSCGLIDPDPQILHFVQEIPAYPTSDCVGRGAPSTRVLRMTGRCVRRFVAFPPLLRKDGAPIFVRIGVSHSREIEARRVSA